MLPLPTTHARTHARTQCFAMEIESKKVLRALVREVGEEVPIAKVGLICIQPYRQHSASYGFMCTRGEGVHLSKCGALKWPRIPIVSLLAWLLG